MADGTRKIPQQISVTCTYCNKPVSYNLMAVGRYLTICKLFKKDPEEHV